MSGVGTFVWKEDTLPTLHCAPEVGSRRMMVRENATQEGGRLDFAGDGTSPACRAEVGEVMGNAWWLVRGAAGVAGWIGVTGRTSRPGPEMLGGLGPNGFRGISVADGAAWGDKSGASDEAPDRRFRNMGLSRYPSTGPSRGCTSGRGGLAWFAETWDRNVEPGGVDSE